MRLEIEQGRVRCLRRGRGDIDVEMCFPCHRFGGIAGEQITCSYGGWQARSVRAPLEAARHLLAGVLHRA